MFAWLFRRLVSSFGGAAIPPTPPTPDTGTWSYTPTAAGTWSVTPPATGEWSY